MTSEMTQIKQYQDFNDSIIDDINSYVAGVISLVANILLIYATSKIKMYSDTVRYSQYSMCIIRLLFSATIVLCCPSIIYSDELKSLYIIKNGLDLPIWLGESLLVAFVIFIIMSCNGPTVQYLQVAHLLSSSSRKESNFIISVIPLFVGIPSIFLVYYGYVPSIEESIVSQKLLEKFDEQGSTAFLLVSVHLNYDSSSKQYKYDELSQLCTYFILIVMAVSVIVVVLTYSRIRIKMRNKFMESTNSIRAQEQLNTVLLVQFILPFLTVHIPFYITFTLPFFNISCPALSDNLIYLFAWCPAINPILVMAIVKNIRDFYLSPFKSRNSSLVYSHTNHTNRISRF